MDKSQFLLEIYDFQTNWEKLRQKMEIETNWEKRWIIINKLRDFKIFWEKLREIERNWEKLREIEFYSCPGRPNLTSIVHNVNWCCWIVRNYASRFHTFEWAGMRQNLNNCYAFEGYLTLSVVHWEQACTTSRCMQIGGCWKHNVAFASSDCTDTNIKPQRNEHWIWKANRNVQQ